MEEERRAVRARGRARGRRQPVEKDEEFPLQLEAKQLVKGHGRGARSKIHSKLESEVTASSSLACRFQQISFGEPETIQMQPCVFASRYEEPLTRPSHVEDKRGFTGVEIEVLANYFRLLSSPDWQIYQYHVDFNPLVESSAMRRDLLSGHSFATVYLFDGMSDLKTVEKLQEDIFVLSSRRRTDNAIIAITIKLTSVLPPNHPEVIRLFNTHMRRNLQHLKFVLLGRHYFDKHSVCTAPQHCLEVWKGVSTAIRRFETGLMMAVDTVHKVVRIDTVLEQMNDILRKVGKQKYIDACTKTLAGSIVLTRYNNRTYRIDDIDWNRTPLDVFDTHEGTTTYKEFYKKQYDIDIKDERQSLLVCRRKRKDASQQTESVIIYLVPELCCMTGLSDEMRSDYNVMRDLADKTRVSPDKRVENLLTFIKRVNVNPEIQKEMEGWGLRFGQELVTITARILPTARVLQDERVVNFNATTADFSREIQRNAMHSCVSLNKWIIITTYENKDMTEDFANTLHAVCHQMGMMVTQPSLYCVQDDKTSTYLDTMQKCYNPKIQMMIFVVPNNKKDRYDAIKKRSCVDIPVHTQVILARTLSKKRLMKSVAVKIAIQLNCKLGGEAWILNIPFQISIMVIGFDSYKDSSQQGKSVCALVASLNKNLTTYYSQVSMHKSTGWIEKSESLCSLLKKSLQKYAEYNKCLPRIIFIYRDGVSDGQIDHVMKHEIEPIKHLFHYISPEVSTRLAFIIVNKRISTRFFMRHTSGIANPPPGTVIDHEVTQPNRYDFFLVSQHVSQGTVTPTQYNVIEDSTGLKPDQIQLLTYKLTYLYYNWPGTIRVPAPCQYAHKLAFLTSQSLHKSHSEALADTLFFL